MVAAGVGAGNATDCSGFHLMLADHLLIAIDG
jgi:hypothetical protein